MSRADFWALAGIVALEVGAFNGGTDLPEIVFRSGRIDCSESPDDDQEFEYPSGDMDHDSMFSYMESHFGYNANQTTALMGAHSLGNLHAFISSYVGTFTTGHHKELNNQFYSDMFENTWTEEQFKKSTLQQYFGVDTSGNDVGARLHTDFELLYKIYLNEVDDSSTCSLEECGHSDTYDLSYEYANVSSINIKENVLETLKIMTSSDSRIMPSGHRILSLFIKIWSKEVILKEI